MLNYKRISAMLNTIVFITRKQAFVRFWNKEIHIHRNVFWGFLLAHITELNITIYIVFWIVELQ